MNTLNILLKLWVCIFIPQLFLSVMSLGVYIWLLISLMIELQDTHYFYVLLMLMINLVSCTALMEFGDR